MSADELPDGDDMLDAADEQRHEQVVVPRWFVYVCPYCGAQYRAPGGHHVAGDDAATNCFHAHPGERGIGQPRLVRVEVQPPADFELRPVPHDARGIKHYADRDGISWSHGPAGDQPGDRACDCPDCVGPYARNANEQIERVRNLPTSERSALSNRLDSMTDAQPVTDQGASS